MWDDDEPFSVLAISQNEVVGGLIGKVFFNWLDAELIWVEKSFRGCGIGGRVLQIAEQAGRGRNLTGIYLWTQSWQAPDFYRKLGSEQFADFHDFPPGHRRLGFRKYL
jgi:GNAT superfamily N-acetyltransferase